MTNIKNKILFLAILFASLLHFGVAFAIHDRITEKAYFEYKTGSQNLDQVINASFTPLDAPDLCAGSALDLAYSAAIH